MDRVTVARRVADRIRSLRTQRGWSARQLADESARTGMDPLSRSTIAKIEAGVRKSVKAEEIAALARAFGVTPTELMSPISPAEDGLERGEPPRVSASGSAGLVQAIGRAEVIDGSGAGGYRFSGTLLSRASEAQFPPSQPRWEQPPERSFWHSLTADEQDALATLAEKTIFRSGTALCREGDSSTYVIVIESGWTKVSAEVAGEQQLVAVRGPGDLIGERAALTTRLRSATVTALEDVQALLLTAERFIAFIEAHPRAREILQRQIHERLAEDHARLFSPEFATVERRLAFLLLALARRRGWSEPDGTMRVTLPMSQQDLAAWAGARPGAVARYLTAWRDRGIIQTGRRLMTVLDAAELEKICGPAPSDQVARAPQLLQAPQLVPDRVPAASTAWQPVPCSILVTDIAASSGTGRSEMDRQAVRDVMYRILHAAFEYSRVSWAKCHHEDRGDGALIMVPSAAVPIVSVVDPLLADLAARLRRHNRQASSSTRIQLRAALHTGPILQDSVGVSGAALIHAARLLDAPILKQELESTGADFGLMASGYVYDTVIRDGPGLVDPATYRQVEFQVKESRITAWMHLSGALAGPAQGQAYHVAGTGRSTPAQLPADVHAFTGRARELAELDRLLTSPVGRGIEAGQSDLASQADAAPIAVVSGTAGVGKSALALRWARQARGAFPGGQLYVNLRGYDPGQPVPPADALAGFLRALGTAGPDIPPDEDDRAAAYRTAADGRRLLILLDNAATVEQVRPLLPGSPSCAVVVTSRDSLTGLVARHGARRLDLDLLPPGDAVGLLRNLIGKRVDDDPGSAATLAGQCAWLPLALRLAAELACDRPATPLTQLAAGLADQRRRLDLLNAGGDPRTAIRGIFSWSYRQLPDGAARAFRLLGMHPGPDFDAFAAATLTGTTLEQARQVLDQLARAHLIHPTSPGRYGMHDLLRAYASHLTGTEESSRGTRE